MWCCLVDVVLYITALAHITESMCLKALKYVVCLVFLATEYVITIWLTLYFEHQTDTRDFSASTKCQHFSFLSLLSLPHSRSPIATNLLKGHCNWTTVNHISFRDHPRAFRRKSRLAAWNAYNSIAPPTGFWYSLHPWRPAPAVKSRIGKGCSEHVEPGVNSKSFCVFYIKCT